MGNERDDRPYGYQGDRIGGGSGGDRSRGDNGRGDNGRGDYGRGDYGRDGGARDDDRSRSQTTYANYGGAGQRDYRGDRFNDTTGPGRDPRGYDNQDRGFLDRAGDEVRSWFGDEGAGHRRRQDERSDQRRYGTSASDAGDYRGAQAGAGDYGYGYNYGSPEANGGRAQGGRHDHDPSYRSWRDRQMDSFDRDYDEYRRENQGRFDSEFATWRQGRQGQRDLLGKVQEHQEVVGSDGQHIGTVDHVRGDRLRLTKTDKDAGGHHHSIPSSWIQSVDDKVTVGKTADQARQHWRDEQRDDGGATGGDGPGTRDRSRSFSGTY